MMSIFRVPLETYFITLMYQFTVKNTGTSDPDGFRSDTSLYRSRTSLLPSSPRPDTKVLKRIFCYPNYKKRELPHFSSSLRSSRGTPVVAGIPFFMIPTRLRWRGFSSFRKTDVKYLT